MKTFFRHIFNKNPIFFTLLDFVNLVNELFYAALNFWCAQQMFYYTIQNSHFKSVVMLYYGSLGATRINFPVQCVFNNKPFPNPLFSWKRGFQHFYFQNYKNPLVGPIFLYFSCNFFLMLWRCCLTLLGIIFNT